MPNNLPLKIFNELLSLVVRLNREYPITIEERLEYPKELISNFSDCIIKDIEIDPESVYGVVAGDIDIPDSIISETDIASLFLLDNLLNHTIIPNLDKYYDMPSAIVYPDSLLEKEARDYLMDCYTSEVYINSTSIEGTPPTVYIPRKRLIAFRYYIKINKISDQDMKNVAIDIVKKAIVRNSLMYIFQNISNVILDILKEKEK